MSWLPGYLAIWLLGYLIAGRWCRKKKSSKKIWGTKCAGERLKLLSESLEALLGLLWGMKIGPKTLFLKKFKKLFNPKNPGITRK